MRKKNFKNILLISNFYNYLLNSSSVILSFILPNPWFHNSKNEVSAVP